MVSPSDPVSRRGGYRPGSGRPPSDSVLIHVAVPRSVYSQIVAEAVRLKVGKLPGGQYRLGVVIAARFAGVLVEESKAVRLARECGLLPKT